jgi:hypothetical protein
MNSWVRASAYPEPRPEISPGYRSYDGRFGVEPRTLRECDLSHITLRESMILCAVGGG